MKKRYTAQEMVEIGRELVLKHANDLKKELLVNRKDKKAQNV